MKGSTFRRCGCRDEAGKLLTACPRLGRERGHGSWYYRADVGQVNGRRREQRKGGFATRAEAEKALAKVLNAVNDGEHRHDNRQTVGAYLIGWIDAKAANGLLRRSTATGYRSHIECDLIPALGHIRLGDLRPEHVERLLTDLTAAGRGATVTRRIHATLRSALSDAKRKRLVTYNAAVDVDLPTVTKAEPQPWSADELADFLDHAAAHRLGALFEVLAFTGMRRGEVCGLRWSDVDLDGGVITVREQLVEVNGKIVKGKPKTRSGERRIEIDPRVIEALKVHRLRQDIERMEWGPGYTDNGRVFAREDGSDLLPSAVTHLFLRLARSAGLRTVRLHDLRHGAASLMLAGGADVAVVSKVLGHSSVSITADIYSHLLPGVGRSAAAAAAALVRPRATV